ncbi:MAG: DNA mismatch repair protein MutT [Anaerolineae bacterium CG17_big_fil_post_rev_8_21_14_2_50_57_27]|nr:MAG: DNA mismatch repair protein MutT [Anaerolineae bacterium CG06_land_8_20_14_3_00_57_67]PIW19290.1 MAG: DNA mismatch repair protein MutT [Anaerolineae bacterium CG17_big_fil_post_rev_8_21_14_2_50_57_27]
MILATLCYLRHEGHTLMLHRVKRADDIHAGKWNGLGGKFEEGETPEECVIREVREESELTIENPRLRGLLMFPGFKGEDWYVFVFTAQEFSGELKENGEGYLKWIPNAELESLPLWPSDHIFFQWLQEEKFFSAKFVYEGEEMKGWEVALY